MMISSDRLKQFANAAASAAINLSRPNYFESNNSRGQMAELSSDLNSELAVVKKEGLKKVIAGMTVGKDVSGLFADVVKCMQTADLEMKKLVYLYLMNYAKTQPELVILAINTFCKVLEDHHQSINIRLGYRRCQSPRPRPRPTHHGVCAGGGGVGLYH